MEEIPPGKSIPEKDIWLWQAFRYADLHGLRSSYITNFSENPTKLVFTFDATDWQVSQNNLFYNYDLVQKQEIINYLFQDYHNISNIGIYICRHSRDSYNKQVILYKKKELNILIELLKKNGDWASAQSDKSLQDLAFELMLAERTQQHAKQAPTLQRLSVERGLQDKGVSDLLGYLCTWRRPNGLIDILFENDCTKIDDKELLKICKELEVKIKDELLSQSTQRHHTSIIRPGGGAKKKSKKKKSKKKKSKKKIYYK